MIRHFLTLRDLSKDELNHIIDLAIEMKATHKANIQEPIFNGKVLAMIFDKSSTRTRVSFEAGMTQLGGAALFLSPSDTQLGRGEPIEDSARVISRMVDLIMIRTFDHSSVERFAKFSSVPVINALTDDYHPCQLLADIQTYAEHRGSIEGKTVAWIGDGNNMCNSWINAASILNFKLNIACPVGYAPKSTLISRKNNLIRIMHDPNLAVKNADLVTTDVFASMGQEDQQQARLKDFFFHNIRKRCSLRNYKLRSSKYFFTV